MNNINGQGLPEEVVVNSASGQVKLNASYHSNGTPQAVTATPAGGEETKTEYDEHGALVMLQRPLEDPIVYNRNQWGTVESMDYAGTNYPIFGSRNDLNWSLSNGVNLTLNDWGQLITVAKQGLVSVPVLKVLNRDRSGRNLPPRPIPIRLLGAPEYDGSVVAFLPRTSQNSAQFTKYPKEHQYNSVAYIYSNGGFEKVLNYTDTSDPNNYPHIKSIWYKGSNHLHLGKYPSLRLFVESDTYGGGNRNPLPIVEGINPNTGKTYADTINWHLSSKRSGNATFRL